MPVRLIVRLKMMERKKRMAPMRRKLSVESLMRPSLTVTVSAGTAQLTAV